jgi:hypothetical protein
MTLSLEKMASSMPSWSEGWYIFEDGQVSGPLTAKEIFSSSSISEEKPRLVSRKGFAQWYPVRDFALIHEMADQYALQLSNLAQLDLDKPAKPSSPVVTPKTLGPIVAAVQAPLAEVALPRQEQLQTTKFSKADVRKMMEQEHLLLRGKMRLGDIKSPFFRGFVATLSTAFFYWGVWYSSVSQEVAWHLIGRSRLQKALPYWLAFIPGVHIYMTWKLASMISGMERQNGYQTTSPGVASLLSIVPPLAVYYLQSAVNDHWSMHIKHSLSEKFRAGDVV